MELFLPLQQAQQEVRRSVAEVRGRGEPAAINDWNGAAPGRRESSFGMRTRLRPWSRVDLDARR